MPRIAVIGSGPAGIYATQALLAAGCEVDVLDRLPAPFGLVRYGVAPDHTKIKSVAGTLAAVLADPRVRFLGNVAVGRDVTVGELRAAYSAVVVAVGASVDRRLGIAGEHTPGSFSATEFVAWYCGHPDAPVDRFVLDAREVAVVGAGNVAVDVARVLLRSAQELRATDVPDHVVDVLGASHVTDVHLYARRGPAQTKITTVELRELGRLAGADVFVADPGELELSEEAEAALDSAQRRNLATLRDWASREPAGRPRRLHVHFHRRPVAVTGDEVVDGLVVERTVPGPGGSVVDSGERLRMPAQLVLRAVGYRGSALPGLPFDDNSGTVPNSVGRVLSDGAVLPGVFVAGWIKRGPTGVIGTNKSDANETVASLLADLPGLAEPTGGDGVAQLLAGRGAEVVDWAGWELIELAEAELGERSGRVRSKIASREALLAAARPR